MHEPRIAWIVNEPPLPYLGAATRSYHATFREFARRNLDFTVYATGTDDDSTRAALARHCPDFCRRVRLFPPGHPVRIIDKVRNLVRPMAFMTGSAMRAALARDLTPERFDIVHVETPWTAHALPRRLGDVTRFLSLQCFLATDFTGAPPPAGIREQVARGRLLQAESALVRRFRHIRVLSAEMARTLASVHPGATAHIVPLPIGPDEYVFDPPADGEANPPVVTMIGSMFWPPSVAAAQRLLERLWPRIREKVPAAELNVVGRDAFRRFGAWHGTAGISVHENVPEILPWFRRASVLVYAPAEGSGTKVKVQESMLLGLPVVTNRNGAEGIGPVHGTHALLAETDDELVAATVRALTDPALRRQLAVEARGLIERQCGPRPVVDRLLEAYEHAIADRRKARPARGAATP